MRPHPDALGCNMYCTAHEHATTVLSLRETAAEVLADLHERYARRHFVPLTAVRCELDAANWWMQHRLKGYLGPFGLVEVIEPPVDLALYTVWRIQVREVAPDSHPG